MRFECDPQRAPVGELGMKFERGAEHLALAGDAAPLEDMANRGVEHVHCNFRAVPFRCAGIILHHVAHVQCVLDVM